MIRLAGRFSQLFVAAYGALKLARSLEGFGLGVLGRCAGDEALEAPLTGNLTDQQAQQHKGTTDSHGENP